MIMQPIQLNLITDIPVSLEVGFSNPAGDNSFSDVMRDTVHSVENQVDTNQDSGNSNPVTAINHDTRPDQSHQVHQEVIRHESPKHHAESAPDVRPEQSVAHAESEDRNEYSGIMNYMDERKTIDQGLDIKAFKQFLEDKNINPENLTGFDFLLNLKDFLAAQGFNLSELSVGKERLNGITALLEGFGFDSGTINDFIDEMKNKSENGINIRDLLAFMENNIPSEEQPEDYLDMSAHPFLSSVLSLYGLSDQEINSILSSATHEGKGIDISRLLEKIREMIPNLDSGTISPDADTIRNLISHLNLMDEESVKPPASIMEFAVLLSKNVKRKSAAPLDNAQSEKHLQNFFRNLQTAKNQDGLEKPIDDKLNHNKNQLTGEFGSKNMTSDLSLQEGRMNENQLDTPLRKNKNSQARVSGSSAESVQSHDTAGLIKTKVSQEKEVLNLKTGTESSDKQSLTSRSGFDQFRETVLNTGDDNRQTGLDKPQETRPAPKALPSHVMNQVNRQLARSLVTGSNNVVINLKPSHLGRLQVNLENTTGSLRVSVVAEHQVSRDILASHAQELKQILSEQGLKVEKVNVELSSDFDQFTGNAKDGKYQDNWQRSGRRNSHLTKSDSMMMPDENETIQKTIRSGNKLDLVA